MGATKRNNFGQRHGLIRIQVCQVPCKRGLMFFFQNLQSSRQFFQMPNAWTACAKLTHVGYLRYEWSVLKNQGKKRYGPRPER